MQISQIRADVVEELHGVPLMAHERFRRGAALLLHVAALRVDELVEGLEQFLVGETVDLHGELSGILACAVVGGWGKKSLQIESYDTRLLDLIYQRVIGGVVE